MDASAIKEISALAVSSSKANVLGTFTPAIVVDGKVFSLEGYGEGRSRFRGKFATNSISDFATYVRDNADSDTGKADGFINPDNLSACVYFNLRDETGPGHADWTATLAPKPTAPYAAIKKIDGVKMSQRDAIDWVEDWAHLLKAVYGTERKPIVSAVAALRDIKIDSKAQANHVERELGAKRSAMEEVEASSSAGIPSALEINCEPYDELKIRDFVLRISILTSGDKPQVVFRIAQREAVEDEIAQEFKQVVGELVGDAASLVVGTFTP